MISVGIFINGEQIKRIDAVRKKQSREDANKFYYKTDEDEIILHDPCAGAVVLGKKMLEVLEVREKERLIKKIDNINKKMRK